MILLLDNYDSFTYNLYQYLRELGAEVEVRRNDKIDLAGVEALAPAGIVVSPGPCTPTEAGISVELIRAFAGRAPILGVCLGHQSVGAAFGATIRRAPTLMHGKLSTIRHDGKGVFAGLPQGFTATRYHSLIVEREGLPPCLAVSAETPDGVIMGLRHRELPIEGVQFHPEAILTEHGHDLLDNFLAMAGGGAKTGPLVAAGWQAFE
ncbi:MAG: Anthranilate synthase, amidotransferase component @ Para-aminobenzoate synthase, amidotransferase component [uncultured Thermomicrobiales bacterium]|uniref:Anthranilate synthase, amidotransferase component @ Para-aminobenzoate synthase, amidotransferase component n=1 Tax=uncultured Thermomicrobiales bacterium TaxID=1645740 RepID=A0A6J4UQ99_9BACT|nr:MAG: Anthranilate synthase, amidotransferase component @ Para-aminobenzoate synthase, amidotransferase component [uncultured Thermomicrobiales bacterium]